MRVYRPPLSLGLLLLTLALALAACGEDDGKVGAGAGGSEPAPGDESTALEHVHGLGVEPGSGTLYVATHNGLFQAPRGQARLHRVGASRQDVMGFAVVGRGRFIGSGHPDPDGGGPPNLGLIASRDRGQSWNNVSLPGEADFHVLRSAGRRVYGFNGGTGKLMASTDGGRRWGERTPPGGMFDLAIDPTDGERIVASTERGLFVSPNAGRAWRRLDGDAAGLLAWPTADGLFLVDGRGEVSRSRDGGRGFERVGSIGGQPAALGSHRRDLYAALGDGRVVRSADGGRRWTVRAGP